MGVDLHIHRGRRKLLFAEIANVFAGATRDPLSEIWNKFTQAMLKALPRMKLETGTKSLFGPRIFKELVTLARVLSDRIVKRTV